MRSVTLLFIAIFGFVDVGLTQIKVSDKAVIKTPFVQCEKCQERVEFFIGHEAGVTSVRVDIRKHTTTVTWLTDRTTLENIKTAIANLGFDADDIEAEEFAFKHLPKECRMHKLMAKPVPRKDSSVIKPGT